MGEYAIRLSDNEEIKIGTCESMYYLRLGDRGKVRPIQGSGFGWFWRLPFPDEDGILPGDYQDHNRGLRLYKGNDDFTDPTTVNDKGIIQLKHECGLTVNVPCYHGQSLPPENEAGVKCFWNGKSWFFELIHLRTVDNKVFPVVHCRWCKQMWRYEWDDVLPYVNDYELKLRLEKYNR